MPPNMVKNSVLKGLYEIEKTIGCGGFAKVKLATHLATGEKVAIKIMDKALLGDDLHRVKLELEALKSLSHENICQLYQVIETDTNFYIVMEYCCGGELFDHIVEKSRLSEAESRMFFRQIVSAVAYLHSLGYAHRDLKPENVLLDKKQNLKLIDFGLCAKPEGGMENPLFTSCGSPTYAAPELILGQQYLGQEVDVWAMGVLLYALLSGSLPFDDTNIDNLYRKILNGKYEVPPYISLESRKLIRSMLQVEPRKRIKVSELLNHPWMTLGVLEPVKYEPKNTSKYEIDCVQVMAKFMDTDHSVLWNELSKWKHDYNTATYLLLINRKKRGQGLKINSGSCLKVPRSVPLLELPVNTPATGSTPKHQPIRIRRKFGTKATSPGYVSPSPDVQQPSSPYGQFLEPRLAQDDLGNRKALKRHRSPVLDEASPVPLKKATPSGTGTPAGTPDRKLANASTPGSARRMLGSLERSLHKVKHVLTPKKQDASFGFPSVLNNKNLCNVSTTQCKDPELVITELSKGLEKKGINFTRKGFALKGSLEPNVMHRFGGCSFELEICYLPNLGIPTLTSDETKWSNQSENGKINDNHSDKNGLEKDANQSGGFVGIRRKRLKGDSWCYKKVCEEVLALTSTGFCSSAKGLESAV